MQPATPAPSALPPEQFSARLAPLGFTAHQRDGGAYILPPLCAVPAGAFLVGSDKRRDGQAYDGEFAAASGDATSVPDRPFPGDGGRVRLFRARRSKAAGWLAKATGQPWRLPTEAEWEKAARGSDGRIYAWGDSIDEARYDTSESGKDGTTPVSSYSSGASLCGAQDLAGNVWEWTSSLYKPYPYSTGDGRLRAHSTGNRVLHGGSCYDDARRARAADRFDNHWDYAYFNDGFRVALAGQP